MATIRKLPSGKWNVQIRRHGHQSVSQTFVIEKDARRWARSIESELDRGVFVDRTEAEATTLSEALKRYYSDVTPHKKGREQESQRVNAWLKRPLAQRSLASLKPKDFATHRDARLSSGIATNTVRLELAIISHLFNIARKEWGIPIQNPIESIRMPKGSKARQRRLEGDETERLLKACKESKSTQLYPLVILAIETGMRLGEMLKLKWSEVDLPRRLLKLGETKNGHSRCVPLSRSAREVFNMLSREIGDHRVFYSWTQHSGSIKKAWANAVRRAELSDLRFHDLRHEATSKFIEKGLTAIEASHITGHKTLTMLMRYTHLNTKHLLDKLE